MNRGRRSIALLPLTMFLASCTFGLDGVPGIEPALSAPIMTYDEYAAIEHTEPYVLRIHGRSGRLLYFGARHTTDPADPQIDSIIRLWQEFQPTVALARNAGIPVYTFEPPLELETRTLLRSWSKERLLMFYVLRSYTARGAARRSDGQARELIGERGGWNGLDRAIRSVAHMDSIWQVEFPSGPGWRELPWQATWPTGTETWLNRVSADVSRFRDQYMVALITTLLERGERVFAVVGSSHVVMQEPALREAASGPPGGRNEELDVVDEVGPASRIGHSRRAHRKLGEVLSPALRSPHAERHRADDEGETDEHAAGRIIVSRIDAEGTAESGHRSDG
jgi:hypothetical protein